MSGHKKDIEAMYQELGKMAIQEIIMASRKRELLEEIQKMQLANRSHRKVFGDKPE